jgi:hypothetical protein
MLSTATVSLCQHNDKSLESLNLITGVNYKILKSFFKYMDYCYKTSQRKLIGTKKYLISIHKYQKKIILVENYRILVPLIYSIFVLKSLKMMI